MARRRAAYVMPPAGQGENVVDVPHYICDTEADLPLATNVPKGSTAFTLDTEKTWIVSNTGLLWSVGGGPGGLSAQIGSGTTIAKTVKDLGAGRSSGTFDITGLSGLTADKVVSVVQTAGAIASKGNARDEPEMDLISATGYVVNATTIRVYWRAPGIVVGNYEFGYWTSG